jgi:hypothetical protein
MRARLSGAALVKAACRSCAAGPAGAVAVPVAAAPAPVLADAPGVGTEAAVTVSMAGTEAAVTVSIAGPPSACPPSRIANGSASPEDPAVAVSVVSATGTSSVTGNGVAPSAVPTLARARTAASTQPVIAVRPSRMPRRVPGRRSASRRSVPER